MTSLDERQPGWEAGAVFLFFSALGIFSMAPSVTFGDAGEFAACAAALGVAHAPSYPLLALLGKALGVMLPWGNWAYRTNMLGALCGAGALALLVSALRLAGAGVAGRMGAALFLGLSPLWRYESGVTEAFSLHVLAAAAILWLLCRRPDRLYTARAMAAMGLVCGLGLANHQTLVLAAPAVAWETWRSWRLAQSRNRDLMKAAVALAACCGLGLALYLFLPLRSCANPPLDWGHPVDWPRFLRAVLRKDYGSLSLTVEGASARSAASAWAQLWRYLRASWAGLGPAALGLAVLGFFHGETRRPTRVGLILWIFFTGPFFLILGNPTFDAQTSGALERFYLISWMPAALLAAGGIDFLGRRIKAAAWAVVLLALAGAWLSRGEWWLRSDFAAYDYGRGVLKSLPRGATLFMDGGDDTFYTTAFLTMAQGRRPDLDLRDRGGLVFRGAYGPDFRGLSRSEKEARRLQVEGLMASGGNLFYSTLQDSILAGVVLQPWGLVRRAIPAGHEAQAEGLWELYPARWRGELLASHYRDRALVCFYPFMKAVSLRAAGRPREALGCLRSAWAMGPDVLWLGPSLSHAAHGIGHEASQRGDWELAEAAMLLAAAAAPEQASIRTSLGAVYEHSGRWSEAQNALQDAIRLDPKAQKAYYNLGAFYWGRSRWAEAAEAFGEAARLDPADEGAARYAAQARQRGRISK